MKKSRLFLKIGAGFLAVGLIVFCCSLTFSFTGNPLVMLMAKSMAKHYTEEKYPKLNLDVVGVEYNFKFREYVVTVSASESEDTAFRVITHDGMNVTFDTYKTDIEQRDNTLTRLSGEYSDRINLLLKKESGVKDMFSRFDWRKDQSDVDYDDFPLDLPFSMQAIRRMNGTLNMRIVCEALTIEEAARIAKEAQAILTEQDMEPAYYSFYFESEYGQEWISSKIYAAEELHAIDLDALAAEMQEGDQKWLEDTKAEAEKALSDMGK